MDSLDSAMLQERPRIFDASIEGQLEQISNAMNYLEVEHGKGKNYDLRIAMDVAYEKLHRERANLKRMIEAAQGE